MMPQIVMARKTTTAAAEMAIIIVGLDNRLDDDAPPSTSALTDGSGCFDSIPKIPKVVPPFRGTALDFGPLAVVDDVGGSVCVEIGIELDVAMSAVGAWFVGDG